MNLSANNEIVAATYYATQLALNLQISGHDIYTEDVLDCLASAGLTLIPDDDIAANAYQAVLQLSHEIAESEK